MNNNNSSQNSENIDPELINQIGNLNFEITFKQVPEMVPDLPEDVLFKMQELYEKVQSDPEEAIPELIRLKEKYPEEPKFYNYLSTAYQLTGADEKADAVTEENYRKNPDYLFARMKYAMICLSREEHGKIPEIFHEKYGLRELYPERNVFHITEFVNFYAVMGFYFKYIGKEEIARKYNMILQGVAPGFDISEDLEKELKPGLFRKLLKRFF